MKNLSLSYISFKLALFAIITLFFSQDAKTFPSIHLEPKAKAGKMDLSYFGMHFHVNELKELQEVERVRIGSWRLWDARVTWSDLEPEKGSWDFKKLDQIIHLATKKNIKITLVLGNTPRWASDRPNEMSAYGLGQAAKPKNINDWKHYVHTVAERYKGKISHYEVWNEVTQKQFWSGSTEDLVNLSKVAYEVIKKVDGDALILAPSGVGLDNRIEWPRKFLEACGKTNCADAVTFHLYHYPHPPESMIDAIIKMRNDLDVHGYKDYLIWNTESGYHIEMKGNLADKWDKSELAAKYTEQNAALWLSRDLLLARALGIEKYYWYAWNNKKLGLIDPVTRDLNKVGFAYLNAVKFLENTTLGSCDRNTNGVWSCNLTLANDKQAKVVWVDARLKVSSLLKWTTPFGGNLFNLSTGENVSLLKPGALIDISKETYILIGH